MKTNEALQKDVQEALACKPRLQGTDIRASVKKGIVTLTGIVDNGTQKLEAEQVAENVVRVRAVVEKIDVQPNRNWTENADSDFADGIMKAFNWTWRIPAENVK